ncbi:MAG: tripartite tricarboxylate transporter permease, partial [Candidatus Tectomicrobia bacterium]
MFESFAEGFGLALRLDTMLYMSGGLFLGMFVGALPGFTTLMAMAILLPISFFLDPLLGIPFLIGVYKGGIYGGSVPAILVSMPGTGAAVATTFDGPSLTRKGQASLGHGAVCLGVWRFHQRHRDHCADWTDCHGGPFDRSTRTGRGSVS